MQIDVTNIIIDVIGILVALLIGYVFPWLREKKVLFWVRLAVKAAEKIFKESGLGKEKKEYVIQFLKDHNIAIDEQKIDVMIEAAVQELDNASAET